MRPCPSPPPPAKSTRSHTRAQAIFAATSISPIASASPRRSTRVEKPRQARKQTPQGTTRTPPSRQRLGGLTHCIEVNNAKATRRPLEVEHEELPRKTTPGIGTRWSNRLQLRRDITDSHVTATMTAYPVDGDHDTDYNADAALETQSLDWPPPSGRVYCVEHFLEEAYAYFIKDSGGESAHPQRRVIQKSNSLGRYPNLRGDRDCSKPVTWNQENGHSSATANYEYDTRGNRVRSAAKSDGNFPAPHKSEMGFGLESRDRVARLRKQIESSLGQLRIRDSVLRRWAWEGRPASTYLNAVVGVAETPEVRRRSGATQTPQWQQGWATPCVFRLSGNPLQCYYCPPSPGGTSGHELSPRRYATPSSPDASPRVPLLVDLARTCGMPVRDAGASTVDESVAWLKEHGTAVKESGSTRFLVDDCGLEPKIVLVEMGGGVNKT